jgi:hypothetical protein
MQYLHQAKLILAVAAAKFYCIHGLTYEMQPKAPGPHVFEGASAHFLWRCRSTIFQYNFESISGLLISWLMDPVEGKLDGLLRVSVVGMTNDICESFVDGKNYGATFGLGKAQLRRELAQSVAHHAEHVRIAPQLHFE